MLCIWSSWCHCHPIVSCSSKIQNGLPFWCQLTQVVLEKRSLIGCSSSVVVIIIITTTTTLESLAQWTVISASLWLILVAESLNFQWWQGDIFLFSTFLFHCFIVLFFCQMTVLCQMIATITHTTVLWPFFRDYLGELVPKEIFFWTSWCKGR